MSGCKKTDGEKRRRCRKKGGSGIAGFFIALFCIAAVLTGGAGLPAESARPVFAASGELRRTAAGTGTGSGSAGSDTGDGLEVTVLDVGQGLSVLIRCGGHCAVYDGGGRDASSYVVSYLARSGISHLDYVIASHYDEDHLAGLIGVLYSSECDQVLCPDYAGDTSIYDAFVRAVAAEGLTETHPFVGELYPLGAAELEILGPYDTDAEEPNNRCLAVRVIYGDTAYLMCGDAEAEEEEEILSSGMEISSDAYIVNHHGSASSGTDSFLHAVSPKASIISCGAGNSYGLPAEETMEKLAVFGGDIYRTDLQGEIRSFSDGVTVWFALEPTDNLSPGIDIAAENEVTEAGDSAAGGETNGETSGLNEPAAEGNTAPEETEAAREYVCNRNTRVFHVPDCRSVRQMKEKNRIYMTETRDQLIAEGYSPCGNCHP